MGSSAFAALSAKQIDLIVQEAKKTGSIKASAFNQIISKQTTNSKKNTFFFECTISSPAIDEVRVLFKGRHYSKNDIDGWPLRKKLSYKKAIKKAFGLAVMSCKKALPSKPFEEVEITVITSLKRSRDDDSPQETAKTMRDCCTNYRIIIDDNRKVVKKTEYIEKIGNEYSMELIIQNKGMDV